MTAWAFVLLLIATLLAGNARTSLWDQDEAAYAGLARSMYVGGHWIVPEFPLTKPHRKPPLAFWLMAGSYAVFGVNEFALRLPGVLALLGTVASVAVGGRFLFGRQAAALAAMMLGSTIFVITLGKIGLTDSILVFFETVAALALLRSAARPNWKSTVLLWLAVAAGVLVKGPPILLMVGAMFLFLLVVHPRRRNLIHLHPWLGLPLALAPAALWVYFAARQDPLYPLFLGYWYVLRRVGGGAPFGLGGPPGCHFLVLFATLTPWTGFLWSGLADMGRKLRRRRLSYVLLGAWLFGSWLIWEIPESKLPTYVLGAFPALALLLARQVQRAARGQLNWAADGGVRAGFRILVGVVVVVTVLTIALTMYAGAVWSRVLVFAPAIVFVGAVVTAYRRQKADDARRSFAALLIGAQATVLLVWLIVVPGLEPARSMPRRLAEGIASRSTRDATVVSLLPGALPSLPFYTVQQGLNFTDANTQMDDDPPPVIDWSLFWSGRFKELEQQVRASRPERLSDEDAARVKLQSAGAEFASGKPVALVLDEAQFLAGRAYWPDAQPIRIHGLAVNEGRFTDYLVILNPAAMRR